MINTSGSDDHIDISNEIINRSLPLLSSVGGFIEKLVLVRLIPKEFRQLLDISLQKQPTFTQVNLQHYGPPMELQNEKYQVAMEILKPGINTEVGKISPVLNMQEAFLLRLIDFEHSIPIAHPKVHKNVLLADKRGLRASLLKKYAPIMEISKSEIYNRLYYARTFEIIGEIEPSTKLTE